MKNKKVLGVLITLLFGFCLVGCGNTETTSVSEVPVMTEEEIKSELDYAYDLLATTKGACDAVSAYVYQHWSSAGLEWVFEDEGWQYQTNNFNKHFVEEINNIHSLKKSTSSDLQKVKNKLKKIEPTETTQGYYDAIKELYLNVDAYHSFTFTFPEGYSKLSYANSYTKAQQEYESLVSAVEFEK